jgi:hypothetical protein
MNRKHSKKHCLLCGCQFLQFALLSVFLAMGSSGHSAQDKQDPLSLAPERQTVISSLANSVQQEIKKEDCSGTGCEILVVRKPRGRQSSAAVLSSRRSSPVRVELSTRESFAGFPSG